MSRFRTPRSAVTLLELIVTLALLGLLLALVRPALDSVSARWRLRAAASQIENVVRFAQGAAVGRRIAAQVMYDVPEGAYWVRVGDKILAVHSLPAGVAFDSVRFGETEVRRDVAAAGAFADGTVDAHEVRLQGAGTLSMSIRFDRLTGEASGEEADGPP